MTHRIKPNRRLSPREASGAHRKWSAIVGGLLPVLLLLTLWALPLTGSAASRGFLILANDSVPVAAVDKEFLSRAFLKKLKTWGDGTPIRPVDLDPKSPVRDKFSRTLLGRSVAAVRSYWQQILFSGRDVPPPELKDEEAVLRYLRSKPGGLGYISDASEIPLKGLKVLKIH